MCCVAALCGFQDQHAEIIRLGIALGFNLSDSAATDIVEEIDAMSAARKSNNAGWDKSTGLAKEHVHKTNKTEAYTDAELVASLEFPNGPCHLTEEFRDIEERYADWMKTAGYGDTPLPSSHFQPETILTSGQSATRRRQTLLNATIHIVHVVNYFIPAAAKGARLGDQGLHDWEVTLTQASVHRALSYAKEMGVHVTFVAAVFPEEEEAAGILAEDATICTLLRNNTQHVGGRTGPPVPYIQDLLQCAVRYAVPLDDSVIIYTNADIGVQEDFYVKARDLAALSKSESVSYSVTRRELLASPDVNFKALADAHREFEALDMAYAMEGEDHKGHDTFIMPAMVVKSIDFGLVTIA